LSKWFHERSWRRQFYRPPQEQINFVRMLISGDEPCHVDSRGWRYGLRRPCANGEDDDSLL